MKRAALVPAIAAALMSVVLVAGCSSSNDKKSSDTTTTRKESGFSIQTSDGSASVSLNGSLPDGWPSDFPVPDDADVAGSGSVSGDTSGAMVAAYRVTGEPSDTFDFYKTNTAFHVTSSSSAGLGSAYVGSVQFDGAFNGSATLAGRNGSTYLAIVLKTGGDAATTTSFGETTSIPTAETTTTGVVG